MFTKFYSTYFSGDAATTALTDALALNDTATALVKSYDDARVALQAACNNTQSTAEASPTQANLDAVVTAFANLATSSQGNAQAAIVGREAVRLAAFTRTYPVLKTAMQNAANKLDAAVNAIGYSGSVTVSNAAIREQLTGATNQARAFIQSISTSTTIETISGAITWLTA